jgi:hypothetical protein
MTDDGTADDHGVVAFRLAKRGEAVPGGDLEDREGRRGSCSGPGSCLPLWDHPGSMMLCQCRSE